jgi:iron complex outermembrane receptor protein
MKRQLTGILLGSALMPALAYGGTSASDAAIASSQASAPERKALSSNSQAPASSGEATSLEAIVVTAQKRSEKLVNVPASVAALPAETLKNSEITSLNDISQLVPGVQIASQGAFQLPFIRGVGTTISGAGFPSNVATYVDGFYQPTGLSNDTTLMDVTDVEVLKGPQGTLFGRDATGGAILLTTQEPSFKPQGEFRASYGSYNTTDDALYVTGGIGSHLAASISANYQYSDGYIHNIFSGKNGNISRDNLERAKLLWTPTNNVSFTLGYEHNYVNDPTGNRMGAYNGWSDGALIPGAVVASAPNQVSDNGQTGHIVEDNRYTLTGKIELGWATLKSLTGYQVEHDFDHFDLDSSSASLLQSNWHLNERTFTQEVNLTSPSSGRFTWVVGAFYYHDYDIFPGYNLTASDGATFNPPFVVFTSAVTTNSGAVYADGTYKLFDKLYLTVGGRYNVDALGAFYIYYPAPRVDFGHTWGAFTPRAILRYPINDSSNIYFSFSEGYKTGALNAQGGSTVPVNPEHVNAYEFGYKAAENTWRLEAAAYYYDYSGLQVQTINNNQSFLQNAAAARIYGAEAHLAKQLFEGFTLDVGGAYTHARYTSFPNANVFLWSPTLGVESVQANVSGKDMILTPEFSGNVTASYEHLLAEGKLRLTATYHYQTKIYFDADNLASQGAYGLLNLRASWTTPDSRYTFSIYGKNVTDRAYRNWVLEGNVAFQQLWGPPAEFGGEIQVNF